MSTLGSRVATAALALAMPLGVWGCGGGDAPRELAAVDVWARPTPTGATTGVVYLTLTTDVDDELVGASVPASIAGEVALHAASGDGGGGAHLHGGGGGEMVTMEQVEAFDVAPDSTLVFEPGGNHIMLLDVADPLVLDERFPITLRFASGRELEAEAIVATNPPA